MSYEMLPIVGSYYHPPAQILLDCLAVGTLLSLLAEPTNEHDPNAVAVFLDSADIPDAAHANLDEKLWSIGCDINQILAQSFWHLGYIPKDFAAQLKVAQVVKDYEAFPVTLAFSTRGQPRVKFPEPVL